MELENIKKKLNALQVQLRDDYGLSRISGGFVHIDLISHDKDYIYIKIKDGVQSDVDNEFFTYRVFYILRQIIEKDGLFISYSNRGKNNLRIEKLKRSP